MRDMQQTVNVLMEDLESGEQFIVELDYTWDSVTEGAPASDVIISDARQLASQYFEDPDFVSLITEEEAEALGLDTYTE